MKLERFRRAPEAPALSLTAMIDVLFLMIIFLVLGANFEQVASVALPKAHGDPSAAPGALTLVLRGDGVLLLEGVPLPAGEAVARLRVRGASSLLILPERSGRVDDLFRWVDLLQLGLGIPVRVGVQPPPAAP